MTVRLRLRVEDVIVGLIGIINLEGSTRMFASLCWALRTIVPLIRSRSINLKPKINLVFLLGAARTRPIPQERAGLGASLGTMLGM